MIKVRIRRDDGELAVRFVCTPARGVMRRVPLAWACYGEESARVMEAVFSGRFAASPRSRGWVRPRTSVVQDGIPALAALGVPVAVTVGPRRRVPPHRERLAIRAARRAAGAAVMARLFAID